MLSSLPRVCRLFVLTFRGMLIQCAEIMLPLANILSRAWDTHGDIYLKKCKEAGVDPHPRAIGSDKNDKNATLKQGNLDSFMQRMPTWTKQGLMEHIVQFVVADDQSFLVLEKPSFRNLLRYLRPNMKDSDIPHRTKLREEIMGKVDDVIERMREYYKGIDSQFSATFDLWQSGAGDPYLSFTVHYIDAPKEKPNNWELKSDLLAFAEVKGNHSGANIGDHILKIVDRYGIVDKVNHTHPSLYDLLTS